MVIREFKENDKGAVKEIFALYWTDPEFLKELSDELYSYIKNGPSKGSSFFVALEDEAGHLWRKVL